MKNSLYSHYTLYTVTQRVRLTSGAGCAYPSGALGFIPDFSGVRVTRSLSFLCDFCLS